MQENEKLTEQEIRVLGCLIEKSLTTPEYYPMTTNALTNACNQKSSRNPVVEYTEDEVKIALETLQKKGFSGRVLSEGARAVKYRYVLPYPFMLNEKELPLMCLLFLRGAQTSGELRTRTDRMHNYSSLEEVDSTLEALKARETGALVKMLERQSGQKENRWIHLLGETEYIVQPKEIHKEVNKENEDNKNLEEEVALMKEEIKALREKLETFMKQFE